MLKYLTVWCILLLPLGVWAQQGTITGKVTTSDAGSPLEMAAVGIKGTSLGTQTNASGEFKLVVPANKVQELVVRYLGYQELSREVIVAEDQTIYLELVLAPDPKQLNTVEVTGTRTTDTRQQASTTTLDPRTTKDLPSAYGDFNKILVTLPGVSSNNELSSTYSVRGGNFDENLVYVNGIEIYRPFLISNAQQEGLSFVNPDLVDNIEFSSGGWQPKYGDKLSSVLSIKYKQPTSFAASVTGGLTGGSIHLENATPNKRVSYLLGLRHKNGQYILKGLQTDGEYRPKFSDAQAYVSVDLGKAEEPTGKTTLGILTSYASNNYEVEPTSRVTTFGTRQVPLRLFVGFEGQEKMTYNTYQAGVNLAHKFNTGYTSELILSGVSSLEREFRDVEAGYRICEMDNSNNFEECQMVLGVGSEFNHARNALLARIFTVENTHNWQINANNQLQFGFKVGWEQMEDKLDEYGFRDSSDYVTPVYYLASELDLKSQRYNAYAQHTIYLDSLKTITYGLRASYWTYNREWLLSPRIQYSFITQRNPDLSFKAALGIYYQPPFYRELRDFDGNLNPELEAQKSVHAIVGSDYIFKAWNRDFKLTTELYYKHLTNVVPYDIDNVRLRYYAKNNAKAYAAGMDLRINGEFIEGAESWLSLGLMTTREDVTGDSVSVYNADGQITGKEELGYIRRPSDQLVNVGVFFQDHLPDNPTIRVYLNLVYGSGLPFGPPRQPEYRNAFSGKSYKRVDIGFSKVLIIENSPENDRKFGLESLWMGLEVLNIIDANNRVSYTYVTDLNNITYAVPNYLTGRRVNLRFVARF